MQAAAIDNPYLAALGAHFVYFNDPDTNLVVSRAVSGLDIVTGQAKVHRVHDSPFLPSLLLILRIASLSLHSAVLYIDYSILQPLVPSGCGHVLSRVTSSLLFLYVQVPHKATKPQKASVQPATDDGRLHPFPRPTSNPFVPQPDPAGGGYAFA